MRFPTPEKRTHACKVHINPIVSQCVTPPFVAKLAELTVGYSHSVRPQEDQYSPASAKRSGRSFSPDLLTLSSKERLILHLYPLVSEPGSGLGSVSQSVVVHNSAVPGCWCPLTLADSAAAAAAAAG